MLFVNNEFECFTLEDERRAEKAKGETRIPEGVYNIVKRKVDSPLTLKYREKYDFFDYHLMLEDVVLKSKKASNQIGSNTFPAPGSSTSVIGVEFSSNTWAEVSVVDDIIKGPPSPS